MQLKAKMWVTGFFALGLFLPAMACFGQDAGTAILGIVPQEETQEKIDALFTEYARSLEQESDEATAVAFVKLIGFFDDTKADKLRQLLYWSHDAEGVVDGMLPLLVVSSSQVSNETIAEAIAPMFDHVYTEAMTFDERRRHLLDDASAGTPFENMLMLLIRIEHPIEVNGRTVLDFSSYDPLLKDALDKEHGWGDGLLRHMFSRSPGQTLLMLAEEQLGREQMAESFLVVEHEIGDYLFWRSWREQFPDRAQPSADVKAHLKTFASDRRWWVRLYVVEIVNRAPELIDDATLFKLTEDKSPMVRNALNPPREEPSLTKPRLRPQ